MIAHIFKKDGWQDVAIVERGNFFYSVYHGGKLIKDLAGSDSIATFTSLLLSEGFRHCEDREV